MVRPFAVASAARAAVEVVVVAVAAEAEDLPQNVGEGVFEVSVRHHVDHRVQRRVEVADPEN